MLSPRRAISPLFLRDTPVLQRCVRVLLRARCVVERASVRHYRERAAARGVIQRERVMRDTRDILFRSLQP